MAGMVVFINKIFTILVDIYRYMHLFIYFCIYITFENEAMQIKHKIPCLHHFVCTSQYKYTMPTHVHTNVNVQLGVHVWPPRK